MGTLPDKTHTPGWEQPWAAEYEMGGADQSNARNKYRGTVMHLGAARGEGRGK